MLGWGLGEGERSYYVGRVFITWGLAGEFDLWTESLLRVLNMDLLKEGLAWFLLIAHFLWNELTDYLLFLYDMLIILIGIARSRITQALGYGCGCPSILTGAAQASPTPPMPLFG